MSSKPPLISVILPAFNCAQFLPEALDSILNQTLSDFELIIIYDESLDQTREIIDGYIAKDARIQFIQGKKELLVGALNLGILAAKGKFIARMDADDVSLSNRFELQVQAMESRALDFCGCNILMIDEAGESIQDVIMPDSSDLITVTLACTVPFAHGSVILRKQFLDDHSLLYLKEAVAEDYDLWCRAYSLGARFGNIRQPLFHYRHFAQSLSKVHAKVVAKHAQFIRRNFVQKNALALNESIVRLIPVQKQLSSRDSGFLLLSAYLLHRQNQSNLVFTVLRYSSFKNIIIAVVKIIRGF